MVNLTVLRILFLYCLQIMAELEMIMLDVMNYETWKDKVTYLLCIKDLGEPINNEEKCQGVTKTKKTNGRSWIWSLLVSFVSGLTTTSYIMLRKKLRHMAPGLNRQLICQ